MFGRIVLKNTAASFLLLSGLAVMGLSDVSAQPAKKGDAKTAKAAKVILGETAKGKWFFTIRDGDDKYLAGCTPMHGSEKEAKEAIEDLKAALGNFKYELKKSEPEEKTEKKAEKK
jgi:flavodoxin